MAVADRIVSLLPSATEIVCALGLAHHLVGVSHSCDHPPLIRSKPRLAPIRRGGPGGGARRGGGRWVRAFVRRTGAVRARVAGRRVARALALGWLVPPFVPGHWVREMVALAGGTLLRGVSGRPSFAVQWAELVGLDPDVLLVTPCGFELAAARADADACRAPLGAVAPRAGRSGRAYGVDATSHFSRPGPRVADGVELLGALFHPDTFPGAPLEGRATVWA